MFWYTFRWLWVKVTKLPKRNAIYFVPTVKWEPLTQILSKFCFQQFFFVKFKIRFPSRTFYLTYLRNGWCKWCETRGNYSTGYYADLEFSRSNCISEKGGPIVMERKGQESIGCPDVKHWGNESTGCCADWGIFDLDFYGQIVSREWEARLSWNERGRSR